MESEKVSVNVKNDKLVSIDLLVEEGLYDNRSEFINDAIELLIDNNQNTIDKILELKHSTINPKQCFIGLSSIDKDYLLGFKNNGIKLSLKGFGSLYFDKDIDNQLIEESVEYISKKIKVHATVEQLKDINNKRN